MTSKKCYFNRPPPQQPPVYPPYNHQPHYSDYQNTLIQEVLYLHSLWHNGPPSSHFTPPFKKPKPSSDKPWPEPGSASGSDIWPAFPTLNKPITRPATLDERAKLAGVKTQLNAIDSCLKQFKHVDDDVDGDEVDDEVEDEVDDGDDEEEREFFEDLFTVDKELRGFYKGNWDGNRGEFYCLVCGVIGKRKKYRDCVGLVQHSMTVSKIGRRKSHRAYGSVVCKILGWDVDRLPSIDSLLKSEVKNHADEDPTVANMESSTFTDTIILHGEVKNHADEDPAVANVETSMLTDTIILHSEVKNHADEDPTVANMETSTVLTELTQTEKETLPSALETDNVAHTNVGCPTVANMETSVVLTKPTQTERETIPSALETGSGATLANTNAGCIAIVPTHVESEVNNHADEDPTIAKMETSVALAKATQTEDGTIPAALEKDNVTSTNALCMATDLTRVEGVVKTENIEGNVAVEVIGDASLSQVEPEGASNSFEKNDRASPDIGGVASAPTCIESETKDTAEGFKVDNHDSEKDIVCSNSEKIVSPEQNNSEKIVSPEQNNSEKIVSPEQNNPELDMQKAINDVGGGNKQCEPSLAENDPYEQLQCLPGVFQIPE